MSILDYTDAKISFNTLERWSYPAIKSIQYDYISDQDISQELKNDTLESFELGESWASLTNNYSTRADNPIHVRVVAKLVQYLRVGAQFPPITIIAERDIQERCGYCVIDGHHRLRALKYQKLDVFSVKVRGEDDAVRELLYEVISK